MAIVGLKMVTLALVDAKTQNLITGAQGLSETGVIEVDSSMLGTKTANISNMEGQATKIPGNNAVQDVLIGPGSPTVALDFNNLDFEVKQKLLGFKSDSKGGYVMQGDKRVMFFKSAFGNIFKNSLLRVTSGCSFAHCSTIKTFSTMFLTESSSNPDMHMRSL